MLQLKNDSPLVASMALFPNEQAIDTLYVIVKGTFALGAPAALTDEQVPIVAADEYWGEPGASSLKRASELHLCKPGTDVVLVGTALAPGGRKVEQLDVEVAVAERRKVVRVFGDRQWRVNGKRSAAISPPQPFEKMPLVYERAFGGVHEAEGETPPVLAEERNPVGAGFRGRRQPAEMHEKPLPNLEDPAQLIRGLDDLVNPCGLGFVAPSWLPRRAYAGTYDEAWQKGRAPYLPVDFDSRFFHAAHPDLAFDRHLAGGEPVHVTNVGPRGRVAFVLPKCQFDVAVRIAGKTERPELHLETVLLEPDEDRLCLTWRGAVLCDKKALKIEEVVIGLQSLDAAGGRT